LILEDSKDTQICWRFTYCHDNHCVSYDSCVALFFYFSLFLLKTETKFCLRDMCNKRKQDIFLMFFFLKVSLQTYFFLKTWSYAFIPNCAKAIEINTAIPFVFC